MYFCYVPHNAQGCLFKLTLRSSSGYLRFAQGKYLNSSRDNQVKWGSIFLIFRRVFGYIYKVYLNNIDKLYIL